MPDILTELAAAIGDSDPATTFRVAKVTALEGTGSFRVKTDATGTAWISRDAGATMTVGDRVWLLQQGPVFFAGGRLSGGDTTPIGCVQPYAGATAPNGWLLCDGSAVSRTTYAALFGVCGTTYGAGNGSTTFNLPNLTDKVAYGTGSNARGATGGASTVTLSVSQIPAHSHSPSGGHSHTVVTTGTAVVQSGTGATVASNSSGNTGGSGTHTHDTVGSGASHENLPPFLALPMIIRAL
jgi:microcystin-dependent protein